MKKVPSSVRDVAAVAAVVAAAAVAAAAAAAAAGGRQRLLRDPSGKVPGASKINSYASMKFSLLLKIIIVKFQNRFHGIEGDVFAVDSRTLYVRGFSYDGTGPVRANSQKIYYSLFAATENSLL